MGNGITDFIEGNPHLSRTTAVMVASITLSKRGLPGPSGLVGLATFGPETDAVDVSLWGLGLLKGPLGLASVATGFIKAIVDDHTHRRVAEVKSAEDKTITAGIRPTVAYSMLAGAAINAQTVALRGGTAWQHPNGVWVYLQDSKGRLVCDYEPRVAKVVYQPHLPLRPVGNGTFKWSSRRGGAA